MYRPHFFIYLFFVEHFAYSHRLTVGLIIIAIGIGMNMYFWINAFFLEDRSQKVLLLVFGGSCILNFEEIFTLLAMGVKIIFLPTVKVGSIFNSSTKTVSSHWKQKKPCYDMFHSHWCEMLPVIILICNSLNHNWWWTFLLMPANYKFFFFGGDICSFSLPFFESSLLSFVLRFVSTLYYPGFSPLSNALLKSVFPTQ